MSGLRALSGRRQSPHFRHTTDPSGTGQIALGESPVKPADVGLDPDQRETAKPSGSPKIPGNPAIAAPSFVNRRFAESEVAVCAGMGDPSSADCRADSLFLGECTGILRDWLAYGEVAALVNPGLYVAI